MNGLPLAGGGLRLREKDGCGGSGEGVRLAGLWGEGGVVVSG